MLSSLSLKREFPDGICPSVSATGIECFNASTAGKKGVFTRIFEVLRDPDLEVLMLDSTMIRAHQHSVGQKNSTPEQEQLGRLRGGVSTKVHVAVDGPGQADADYFESGTRS